MQIEIGFSDEHQRLFDEFRTNIQRAADDLEKAACLMAEVKELNLRAKRLLLENARLMRQAVGGPAAMHIADEGDEMGGDERDTNTD